MKHLNEVFAWQQKYVFTFCILYTLNDCLNLFSGKTGSCDSYVVTWKARAQQALYWLSYRQLSNIRCTLGYKFVDHSCSWSITCRRCSNYIFFLDLAPGFNGLGNDNCKTRRGAFKLWDLVHLILEIWRYMEWCVAYVGWVRSMTSKSSSHCDSMHSAKPGTSGNYN